MDRCPECDGRITTDSDDSGASWLTCTECGYCPPDNDSPLAVTEQLFAWARANGHMEP